MKAPKVRQTTSVGSDFRGNAIYNSLDDAVIDYALWQAQAVKQRISREDYLKYLGDTYAEDPDYVRKVEIIASDLNTKLNK